MSGESFKFNRSYVMKVEVPPVESVDSYVTLNYPFTLEFSISRNNLSATNTAHFVVYNLNPSTRSKIYKDVWDISNFKAIQLFAGYAYGQNDLLPMVFNGTIKAAYSQRSGSDFRTVIEAFDGLNSFATQQISQTVPSGTTQKQAIEKLVSGVDGVKTLTLSERFTQITQRSASFMGTPQDVLGQASGGSFYMDSGNAYALDLTDVLEGEIRTISVDNGLLGTPRKAETLVEIEMLFEPRIKPSQLIELQSRTEPRFNGLHKVTGIVHRGTISGSVGGDCRTTITLTKMSDYHIVIDKATQEYMAVKNAQ